MSITIERYIKGEIELLPPVLQRRMAKLALLGYTFERTDVSWIARSNFAQINGGFTLEKLLTKMVGIVKDHNA